MKKMPPDMKYIIMPLP